MVQEVSVQFSVNSLASATCAWVFSSVEGFFGCEKFLLGLPTSRNMATFVVLLGEWEVTSKIGILWISLAESEA